MAVRMTISGLFSLEPNEQFYQKYSEASSGLRHSNIHIHVFTKNTISLQDEESY
jgi:hypothetical protein